MAGSPEHNNEYSRYVKERIILKCSANIGSSERIPLPRILDFMQV
jgi:hypothetical protein